MKRRAGFTLVEVIVVIVLLGIIGSAFGKFILPAFQAYQAMARRAELVDAADSALRRMARDIRISLPNSVRVIDSGTSTSFALEMIPTIDGGRYCIFGTGTVESCTTAAQVLDFAGVDSDFDILGCFRNAAFTGATFPSTAYRLAIGNAGNEVYSGGPPAVITPSGGSITLSTVTGGGTTAAACGASSAPPADMTNRHHIAIGGGFAFGNPSTRGRVFVVETASAPVSYVCDSGTTPGTLKRYAGYAFAAVQPNPPGVAGLLVANNVTACAISTSTSVVQTVAMVTIDLTISGSGEAIRLIQQVPLDNSI